MLSPIYCSKLQIVKKQVKHVYLLSDESLYCMTSVVDLVHLHAQVVLTVAIAFIVEAFVHKYHLAQFTTEKGTYVRIYNKYNT